MRWTLLLLFATSIAAEEKKLPKDLARYFTPPKKYQGDTGKYSSQLKFYDGKPVKTKADWQKRRAEILSTWHGLMGP